MGGGLMQAKEGRGVSMCAISWAYCTSRLVPSLTPSSVWNCRVGGKSFKKDASCTSQSSSSWDTSSRNHDGGRGLTKAWWLQDSAQADPCRCPVSSASASSFSASHAPPQPGCVFLSPIPPGVLPLRESCTVDADYGAYSPLFRISLAVCAVAQWMKIAGALSVWVSRLRLKYFDYPLTYKNFDSKVGKVGVFWDLENCPVPLGVDVAHVVKQVSRIGAAYGSIQCIRAYGKLDRLTRQAPKYLKLGVELCPVPDGKESADKAIIMDALLFAFDHKPPLDCTNVAGSDKEDTDCDTVVVVTGDRGFAGMLKELAKRGVTTIVIGNAHQPLPSILARSADFCFGWDEMISLGHIKNGCLNSNPDSVYLPFCTDAKGTESDIALSFDNGCRQQSNGERQTFNQFDVQLGSTLIGSSQTVSVEPGRQRDSKLFHNALPSIYESCSYSERSLSEDAIENTTADHSFYFCTNCGTSGMSQQDIPIGGRMRVLRHLRCEIAFIVNKYCAEGKCISSQELTKHFEAEMGHSLVSGYYGFGSLSVLLQSMPDLVSMRPLPSAPCKIEIFPFFVKGQGRLGRFNHSREDLRCILYEILKSHWPSGISKDNLGREHARVTGRPLVLVAYEFLKTGDALNSMRDIIQFDSKSKQLRLVVGAKEPQGYSDFVQGKMLSISKHLD